MNLNVSYRFIASATETRVYGVVFFSVCLNENYAEARMKRVIFTDIQIEDVAAMLDFICPNEKFVFNRKITG